MSLTEPFATLADADTEMAEALTGAGLDVAYRPIDRLAAAHDASHYRLIPQLVVTPRDATEVGALVSEARRRGRAVTFRSGATSLSGQASTSEIAADTRRHFRSIEVSDEGKTVRAQPGATVRAVNARLSRFGRKLGPDPASEVACTIGGVVANNSSGMSCGIAANSYQTLQSLDFVLATGTRVDTSDPNADELLRAREPDIYQGILDLRDRINGNPGSVDSLRRLHSIKNTMGYGLNAFVDFDKPVDILQHLIVGSEGTLAFVAEATFRTLRVADHAATAFLLFDGLGEATQALPGLVDLHPSTIELLDAASLRAAQLDPSASRVVREMQVRQHAALLVEFQDDDLAALTTTLGAANALVSTLPLASGASFSQDAGVRAELWRLRKGLFTAVASNRPVGSSALLEDIAVPVDRLYATCAGLLNLFDRHHYEDSVIFGHAKDGNVHFMLNERFDDPASLRRYEEFTEDLVELVLDQGGTLKAEHGTGRVMAPFVRRQYGDELYEVMRAVKDLLDPDHVLNPGVVLVADDPRVHLAGLKTSPKIEPEVDRCVECGYCEPVCPSKDLTLTPRERIAVRREMTRATAAGDLGLVHSLENDYAYEAVDTCAADGMCQTACPVLIDTGDLVRRLRSEDVGRIEQGLWGFAARHWSAATGMASLALTTADHLPVAIPRAATTAARKMLGGSDVPAYSDDLPAGGRRPAVRIAADPVAVLFASCTQTMFAPTDGPGVSDALAALCERAGLSLRTPTDLTSLCCGTPWKSKGMQTGWSTMREQVTAALRTATDNGRLPIVCDATSCTEGLTVLLHDAAESFTILDAATFVRQHVLDRLPPLPKVGSVMLHPTCASTRLGLNGDLTEVAAAFAERVIVPEQWGCCAFAGDRGLLHPELTASATELEAAEVTATNANAHISTNRTCELAMTRATGRPYRHVIEVLADAHATDPSSASSVHERT